MAAVKEKVVNINRGKKGCQHLDVTRTHEGESINRLECNDCDYIFFMDHALYDRLKTIIHRTERIRTN